MVIGALVTWYQKRDTAAADHRETRPFPREPRESRKPVAPESSAEGATFDFYLLAMSVHAAFCEDGHARLPECTERAPRPLVLHGLWPEAREPGAYPHDCPAPPLDLEPALASELEEYMPGMQSDLHEHEWRKHGGCARLGDDEYFRDALQLAKGLDRALSARLTTLAGGETSAAQLREYADQFQRGLGATLVFQCRTLRNAPASQRKRPFLVEIRQCVDNDGPGGAPKTLLNCADFNRRDQGCGGSFRIAGKELR